MNQVELIAKQQIEIEELKQEIGYLKDCKKQALNELIHCEQWSIESDEFPRLAMNCVVNARQALED